MDTTNESAHENISPSDTTEDIDVDSITYRSEFEPDAAWNFITKPVINPFEVFEEEEGYTMSMLDLFSNKIIITRLIRHGLPYHHFTAIQDYTPLSEADWSDVLDLSPRTLTRYKKGNKNFKPLQSEKILEMAEVTVEGLKVFKDMNKFKLWLQTPNFALGSKKPIDLIKDSYGKDLVIAELTRIDEGVFV